jgi:hypothetical protein
MVSNKTIGLNESLPIIAETEIDLSAVEMV